MTRKDYIALAAALLEARKGAGPDLTPYAAIDDAVARVADALRRDNPRFDRGRFLDAAGFGDRPEPIASTVVLDLDAR